MRSLVAGGKRRRSRHRRTRRGYLPHQTARASRVSPPGARRLVPEAAAGTGIRAILHDGNSRHFAATAGAWKSAAAPSSPAPATCSGGTAKPVPREGARGSCCCPMRWRSSSTSASCWLSCGCYSRARVHSPITQSRYGTTRSTMSSASRQRSTRSCSRKPR